MQRADPALAPRRRQQGAGGEIGSGADPQEREGRLMRLTQEARPVSPAVRGRMATSAGEHSAFWRVPEEAPLAVLINGAAFAVMMATPADFEDFALGFALTEGLVRAPSQLRGLRVAEAADGFVLNLLLDPAQVASAGRRRRALPGRSGCGICGAQTIGAALPRLPRVAGRIPAADALRRAYAALPKAQAMNAENHSTHAAAFCDGSGDILLLREDIGRHNALDKLGGALVRAGLRARDGFILLSSRISVEMVQKAAMLGAPFLAAVSGPSALALRQAAASGMGLACGAGGDVMLFDGPPTAANDA
jgi:FdhD protein